MKVSNNCAQISHVHQPRLHAHCFEVAQQMRPAHLALFRIEPLNGFVASSYSIS